MGATNDIVVVAGEASVTKYQAQTSRYSLANAKTEQARLEKELSEINAVIAALGG